MNNDDEVLKARIEEAEKDLLFYLRFYHELSPRSENMKTVMEKEIKRLEALIKHLYSLL